MDQRELVERAQRGDHDAFAVLAGMFVARLDAAARLILRDHELARDAVQEGFLRAWRNLPTLRDPDRFEGWLRSLVVRSCIDVLRRRGRRPMEVELARRSTDRRSPTSPRSSPTAICSTSRSGACGPEQRAVIVLHYYLGMPLPDVAATLGIPIGTAKSRHHRSLALMRAAIDADHERRTSPVVGRAVRMTAFDRIERRLPELIDELAAATIPDYFDDMLRQTARARQRPAWSGLERWLPMGVIARPLPVRPVPWRAIAARRADRTPGRCEPRSTSARGSASRRRSGWPATAR